MTVDEIFSQLAAHMIEGLMVHSQMTNYYNFLGLKGYKMCHKYHYYSENKGYMEICNYYLTHYNKIPLDIKVDDPHIIPEKWFKYSRQDVDNATRKAAIQQGFERWVNWEKQTKVVYQGYYKELITLGEIDAANEVMKYVEDVSYELKQAEQKYLELKMIDFNINDIMVEQKEIHNEYKKKVRGIEL